jgi:hypothetical protein
MILRGMLDLCWVIFETVVDLFRPRAALGADAGAATADHRAATGQTGPSAIFGRRQSALGLGLSVVSENPRCARHRSTRHRGAMASRRLPMVLAL